MSGVKADSNQVLKSPFKKKENQLNSRGPLVTWHLQCVALLHLTVPILSPLALRTEQHLCLTMVSGKVLQCPKCANPVEQPAPGNLNLAPKRYQKENKNDRPSL